MRSASHIPIVRRRIFSITRSSLFSLVQLILPSFSQSRCAGHHINSPTPARLQNKMPSDPSQPGTRSTQGEPAPKRRRLEPQSVETPASEARRLRRGIASLQRSVSPPARRSATEAREPERIESTPTPSADGGSATESAQAIPSPFQLTRIRDLPASANVDTVGIEDVLRDPLITETWVFNYMFDVDWLMNCLDPDTRALTQVKVVHGNWKREDPQRMRMEASHTNPPAWAQQYPNLEVIKAYMPEPFGTHHSKMLIHFRADDAAQVIIHTANMIPQDWANMTQAVWRSPLLPLLPESTEDASPYRQTHPIGSGMRFGSDLRAYLEAYGARLRPLATRIARHDFDSVRAALVASVPGRVKLNECDPARKTAWGWVGLREVLAARPAASSGDYARDDVAESTSEKDGGGRGGEGMVVAQISSIASLGAADRWLQFFHQVLATPSSSSSLSNAPSTLLSLSGPKPPLRIIFPTPADVRRSLDGYASGGSIHTKTQANAAQRRQAESLRPNLCRWDAGVVAAERDARRGTAAPHVKTYVRFSGRVEGGSAGVEGVGNVSVDWALLTSANLSTQAWGALASDGKSGGGKKKKTNEGKSHRGDQEDGNAANNRDVRICSWEMGVCVWPALFSPSPSTSAISNNKNKNKNNKTTAVAVMLPVFGSDQPLARPQSETEKKDPGQFDINVGLRLPYSLPLKRYAGGDDMWCATATYEEPDRWEMESVDGSKCLLEMACC
ncbi:putative tyrosyl-DNA phosphodiesterase [Phyllosticta citriasiana]|uniref:putative tyrosyl-DNA phosphodiesterase n=1 Tax=Phyllosticta citriasiana TaxID=595635 RepID=UPI0030FD2AB9